MFKKIKRTGRTGKALSVAVSLALILSSVSYAQVSQPATGADTAPGVIATDLKAALPNPGNVTVNFKEVDIKTVLHYLSEVSGVDIIPSPGVEGKVTMRLRDKPWEVALDIVTRNYGYVYSKEGDIIRVIPKGQLNAEEPVTEVITLNNLIREIELKKELSTDDVIVEAKEESIDQLMLAVNAIVDSRRGESATFIESVNSIIVTAIPARVSAVKAMIAKIDTKTPQIVMDVKVIEIGLTKDERFGIDWNTVITISGAERPTTFPFKSTGLLPLVNGPFQEGYFPTWGVQGTPDNTRFPYLDPAVLTPGVGTAPTAGAIFSYGSLDFSTFTATLQLLKQRGDTEVLSSPRITTLDNQKATIKVVDKLMLQKTQETTATQAVGVVTVEFEKEDDARETGVKLTVIPHVNDDNEISVNLLPEVSTNSGFTALPIVGNITTYALTFNSREANTIIRVKDGETAFLGGLIRKTITKTDNKFPILGDLLGGIPGVGGLFRYEADVVTRSELVFFVTVYLVKDGKDTIPVTRTEDYFDRYVVNGAADDLAPSEIKTKAPKIKKGKVTIKKGQKEVKMVPKKTAAKKEYKPFLDFRKKE